MLISDSLHNPSQESRRANEVEKANNRNTLLLSNTQTEETGSGPSAADANSEQGTSRTKRGDKGRSRKSITPAGLALRRPITVVDSEVMVALSHNTGSPVNDLLIGAKHALKSFGPDAGSRVICPFSM